MNDAQVGSKVEGEEVAKPAPASQKSGEFKSPLDPAHGLEDGRTPWDWRSKYPLECKPLIRNEAILVGVYLAVFLLGSSICAGLGGKTFTFDVLPNVPFSISAQLLLTFFVGALGGTTFSIKWLMHSVATGKWHLDRIYWRVFVPLVGGVYAVTVLQLFAGGLVGGARPMPTDIGASAALAFLLGYFSDGVSGLLTNVANAVFGTVEKK